MSRTVLCSCRGWRCGSILKPRDPLCCSGRLLPLEGEGSSSCPGPAQGRGSLCLQTRVGRSDPGEVHAAASVNHHLKKKKKKVFNESLANAGCVGIFIIRAGHSSPRKRSAVLVFNEGTFAVELVERKVLVPQNSEQLSSWMSPCWHRSPAGSGDVPGSYKPPPPLPVADSPAELGQVDDRFLKQRCSIPTG